MIDFNHIYKQDYSLLKNINKHIMKTVKKTDFIMGEDVINFEKIFAKYCNTSYAVSCVSSGDSFFSSISPNVIGEIPSLHSLIFIGFI